MAFRSQKQMEWLKVNKPELYEEFKKTPPEDEIRARGSNTFARAAGSIFRYRNPRRRG